MTKLFSRLDDKLSNIKDEHIVYAAVIFTFLHYTVSIIGIALLFIYILFYRTKKIFSRKSSYVLLPFALIVLGTAVFYRNYLGLIAGVGLLAILFFGQYLKTVLTKQIVEKMLNIACYMFLYTAVYAIAEFILVRVFYIDNGHSGRAASVFFNPNYYGTICSIMFGIALYKLFIGNMKKPLYYFTVLSGIIGLVLCMSVFSVLEAIICVALILYYTNHRYLLATYLCLIVLGFVIIFFVPALFTRLSDVFSTLSQRVRIWRLSFIEITEAPLFGKGAMTYNFISESFKGKVDFSVYVNYHAHNLVLDCLINYGFVGTGILLYFIVSVVKKCSCENLGKRDYKLYGLVKAVFISMLCHSLVDITFFWVQTGMLYILVFSTIGAMYKMPYSSKTEIEHTSTIIE